MALSTRALVLARIFAASSGKRCASVATMRNSAAASGSQARPVMVSPMVSKRLSRIQALELRPWPARVYHVAFHQTGDDRGQQIRLVLEALIDGAGRHAGLMRHLVDAGWSVAVAQEYARGGRDQGIGPRRFRAAAGPAHR